MKLEDCSFMKCWKCNTINKVAEFKIVTKNQCSKCGTIIISKPIGKNIEEDND